MELWQAAILGLVEGATEFLPVSSTGHLIVAQRLLGIPDSTAVHAFEICIQAGAILAVFAVFLRRLMALGRGLLGKDAAGRRLALQLVLAFVPAAIAAKLFQSEIKEHLFGLWPVASALFVGGVVLLAWPLLRRGRPGGGTPLEGLSWRAAFGIGCVQCLALWPGTSRSLATLAGGLAFGLSSAAAVEFSLLLGFVTLGAATADQALEHGTVMVAELGYPNLVVGFLAAFVSAWVAVRALVRMLEKGGLAGFGWYRIVLAVGLVLALVSGWLPS